MQLLAPIDPDILAEAAAYLMQLSDSDMSEQDQAAFERWRQLSPQHTYAWERAMRLSEKLGSLPSPLAMPVLARPRSRRSVMIKVATLLLVLPVGRGFLQLSEQGWTADYHTATGERRDVALSNGGRITLNTATSLDVLDQEGLIRLYSGEVLLQTGNDQRPLWLNTAQGRMQAVGARFLVRQLADFSRLTVLDGAVKIEALHQTKAQMVLAGQSCVFTAQTIEPACLMERGALAWTQGMLMADQMLLIDFAAELSRYRLGMIYVDPSVARVQVSGAFPLANTDQVLAMLAETYSVQAILRMGGRWVTLTV